MMKMRNMSFSVFMLATVLFASNVFATQGFDYLSYLSFNADLPQKWTKSECMEHYKLFGFSENRAVSFNLEEYLNANPDLPTNWSNEEALNHYNVFGRNENRLLAFSADEYLTLYPDLPRDWSYEQAFAHYLYFGRNEGRIASFDETAYLELYSDLPSNWGQNECFSHYLYYGQYEGRVYDPYDESVFTNNNETLTYLDISEAMKQGTAHVEDCVNLGKDYSAQRRATAMFLLAIATVEGNPTAESKLIEHIHSLFLYGGPDLTGGLASRGHAPIIAALALLHQDIDLWNRLMASFEKPYGMETSSVEKNLNLLMTGALVASAATTSTKNDMGYDLSGEAFGHNYNANILDAVVSELISAILYFGTYDAKDILEKFKCEGYIEDVTNVFSTVADMFSTESSAEIGCEEIENFVKGYSFKPPVDTGKTYGIDEFISIFNVITDYTFSNTVSCTVCKRNNDGIEKCGGIKESCLDECMARDINGDLGMLQEFNAIAYHDSLRSSLNYSANGWFNYVILSILLKNSGEINGLPDKCYVGTEDLFDKVECEYHSIDNGKEEDETIKKLSFGYELFGEILWNELTGENN